MALNNPQLADDVVPGMLTGLANAPSRYVADKFLPGIRTSKRKGVISSLSAGEHFGLDGEDGAREYGGEIGIGAGPGFAGIPYQTQPFWRGAKLPKELQLDADGIIPVPLANVYLAQPVNFLRVGRERRLAETLFGAAWPHNPALAGADKWNTTTSDPVGDMVAAKDSILGGAPDSIIMTRGSWVALQTNRQILDVLKTTQDNAILEPGAFASAVAGHLGVAADRIFVMMASRLTTSNPDDASDGTKLTSIGFETGGAEDWFWIGSAGDTSSAVDVDGDLVVDAAAISRIYKSDFADNFDEEWKAGNQAWYLYTGVEEVIQTVTLGLGAIITTTT